MQYISTYFFVCSPRQWNLFVVEPAKIVISTDYNTLAIYLAQNIGNEECTW